MFIFIIFKLIENSDSKKSDSTLVESLTRTLIDFDLYITGKYSKCYDIQVNNKLNNFNESFKFSNQFNFTHCWN